MICLFHPGVRVLTFALECCVHYQEFRSHFDSLNLYVVLYSQTNGNLFTMTTFLSRQTVHTLTLSLTTLQRQLKWPVIKHVINWQNNLSTTASFSVTDEKVRNGHKN